MKVSLLYQVERSASLVLPFIDRGSFDSGYKLFIELLFLVNSWAGVLMWDTEKY